MPLLSASSQIFLIALMQMSILCSTGKSLSPVPVLIKSLSGAVSVPTVWPVFRTARKSALNTERLQRAKKDIWDDEPDEEEIAVVNTPVGEPLILILFAFAFFGFKYYRRRNA